jgi:hypothetical protein
MSEFEIEDVTHPIAHIVPADKYVGLSLQQHSCSWQFWGL